MQLRTRLTVLSLLLAVATPLHAQIGLPDVSGDSVRVVLDSVQAAPNVTQHTVSEPLVTGAPLTGLRAGVHLRETSRPSTPNIAQARAGLGPARAMMVVGAAALVTGAI